jgi:peptidoglycan L-alanyl-D-glutamate endopeptidase CwlK
MTYALGAKSRAALDRVHPKLVAVIERAIEISDVDFRVIEGVRTKERQKHLYAQGRTRPGPKVTWTLNSNHFVNPKTGYGHAVDLLPAPYDWKLEDPKSTPEIDDNFAKVAKAMLRAADELKTPIRWGANWDGDAVWREKGETDNPHFELVL